MMAIGAVIFVNVLLTTFFRALVEFEGHETQTQMKLAHTVKLFGSMLMNTAFIVLLISGNMALFTQGSLSLLTRGLDFAAVLSGTVSDLTSEWYLNVGVAIVTTMLINVIALNTAVVKNLVVIKLLRCLDRGISFDMRRTTKKLQVQLEALYTGPELQLEERYAALLVIYFVCMIFSGGMPILWFVGWVSFLVCFLADKWAFLRVYRTPPKYGATLARFATGILPVGVLVHVIFATWTFSQPNIFEYAVRNACLTPRRPLSAPAPKERHRPR
jgi:hypothetical protein